MTDFSTLLESERSRLYLFCFNLTHNREQAEDLCQEALIRAWTRKHLFEEVRSKAAWLKRIAYRLYLDYLKLPSNQLKLDSADAIVSPEGSSFWEVIADDRDEVGAALMVMDLNSAVSKISPQYVPYIQMAAGGYGKTQIAKKMRTTAGAAGGILHRARKQLAAVA